MGSMESVQRRVKAWIVMLTLVALPGTASGAPPLDLANATPRWIEVRFEVSSHESPGQLDQRWSSPRLAYVEPDGAGNRLLIRMPGRELEDHLRSTGSDPIRGTFSDFLWEIDSATGHVDRAEVSGRVRERIALGFLRSSAEVEIRVEMSTHVAAGFRPPHRLFGQQAHAYCSGTQHEDCTLVEPARFDPRRGYVNAVGRLRASSRLARLQTFSPLGEVVFTEKGLKSK